MRFDIFCSLTPATAGGRRPTEAEVLSNLLDQCRAADQLGYGTVWVAESHNSNETQKRHPRPVLPHWDGEVGLNTDVCLLAPQVFARTRRLDVGSAITNIVANGGPVPAAERVTSTLAWHGLDPMERRRLRIGFSSGRFDFVNELTGVRPRNAWEHLAWRQVRRAVLWEAAEIFVRLVSGAEISSADIEPVALTRADFPDEQQWHQVLSAAGQRGDRLPVPPQWSFLPTRIVPLHPRRELLRLYLGSADPALQTHLNRFAPVRVFNLSITPDAVIEQMQARMAATYHPSGGDWRQEHMPRTTFVFLDARPGLGRAGRRAAARDQARATLGAYWRAMQGTIDAKRVAEAADNALVGDPEEIADQIVRRFHPEDRLMLWFDFVNHDNARVIEDMAAVMREVVPLLQERGLPVRLPADEVARS
ncbi:LLM class flavin-dependent oxidoreductase [Micromonospora sp. Llam7]|uniref:LLM class flavin-dependent oxidoreductase n=1 Tax=Micromonospora tarapacensis TaxID=2835305 RepID=UPI001C83DD57|nr:LLM class flavin-dependent oxidoreductase [Micromonospora tarapacensis]